MYLWQTSLKTTLLALVFLNLHFLISAEDSSKAKWWKGNLHTHSLWSDGDDFPEMIVNWYVEHGYNFLALSDHNILSEGNKWIIGIGGSNIPQTGAMQIDQTYFRTMPLSANSQVKTILADSAMLPFRVI